MLAAQQPLVSVVTPVYNCAAYIAECIESILKQSYTHWEYIIVNNRSTDGTAEIAEQYAVKEPRIRVHHNEEFLDIIPNHNKAFRLISSASKYCKDVSADDWILPECLERMVAVAEAHPSVGIVGSYQISGGGTNWRSWSVRWGELPYGRSVIPGREVCRSQLLGGPYVFGSPTSTMYRADLVRGAQEFYPNATPHTDTSACYKYLRDTDFGFVYQVLSYERIHESQISSSCRKLDSYRSSFLSDLLEYGPFYLTKEELARRVDEVLNEYYRFLAINALGFPGKEFWDYHKKRLTECGRPLSHMALGSAIFSKCLDLALNPKQTAEKLVRRLNRRALRVAA